MSAEGTSHKFLSENFHCEIAEKQCFLHNFAKEILQYPPNTLFKIWANMGAHQEPETAHRSDQN